VVKRNPVGARGRIYAYRMGSNGRGRRSFMRALRNRVVPWPALAAALLFAVAATSVVTLRGADDGSEDRAAAGHAREVDTGGSGATPATAASRTHHVAALDDIFRPRRLVVAPGDAVVWTNQGSNPHSVTADDGAFDSGELGPGESFRRTFTKKGVHFYFCVYHGATGRIGMWGVVVVADKKDSALIEAGSNDGDVTPATGNVVVGDDFFSPQKLQIRPGDTVVWGSAGSRPHTATSEAGAFDSGTIAPGATFTHTFTKEGVYFYFCRLHGGPRSGMWGVIVVSRSAASVAIPGGAPPTGAGNVSVPPGSAVHRVAAADGDVFSPHKVTIRAGDTVIWTNRDSSAHTVTSDTRAFNSGSMGAGVRFSHTFRRTGTFYYHCAFHGSARSGMWGVIVVVARGQDAGGGGGVAPPPDYDADNSGHGNADDDPSEELREARQRCEEEIAEARADGDPDKIEEARRKCEDWLEDAAEH
jgi:plastocyanin